MIVLFLLLLAAAGGVVAWDIRQEGYAGLPDDLAAGCLTAITTAVLLFGHDPGSVPGTALRLAAVAGSGFLAAALLRRGLGGA
ncbi:MAG: hypothetical protein M0031_09130 [Thermaerobacter sp.]|jgi:hypothetical protein|nr:hypothetical protein [Thermaerobacter sp.]